MNAVAWNGQQRVGDVVEDTKHGGIEQHIHSISFFQPPHPHSHFHFIGYAYLDRYK